MKSRLLQGPEMICTSVVDGAEKTKKKTKKKTKNPPFGVCDHSRGNEEAALTISKIRQHF